MKKIIILAFDCNPYKESESLIAFNTAKYLSFYNDVTIITKPEHRRDNLDYMSKNNNIYMKFLFVDNEKYSKCYENKKGPLKILYLKKYANKWFESVNDKLRELFNEQHYDVIYRVTPNSFRIVPDLSNFKCKKILGPVGGAQEIPKQLRKLAKGKNKIIEYIHRKENLKILKNKKYKKIINDYDYIMCCNDETYNSLKHIYKKETIECLTDVGIAEEDIIEKNVKHNTQCINFLWVGRFMFRKGLDLLMNVLKEIKDYNFRFTFVGNGPDFEHIKHLAHEYNLEDKIIFTGRVEKSKINDFYRTNDVFVFPSLRESSGNVLAEALANGLPIIAFDVAGAKTIVPSDCGKLIDVNQNYNEIVRNFKNAMIYYIENKVTNQEINSCIDYARNKLEWKKKISILNSYLNRGW